MNWNEEIKKYKPVSEHDVVNFAPPQIKSEAVQRYNRSVRQIQKGNVDMAAIALKSLAANFPDFVQAVQLNACCQMIWRDTTAAAGPLRKLLRSPLLSISERQKTEHYVAAIEALNETRGFRKTLSEERPRFDVANVTYAMLELPGSDRPVEFAAREEIESIRAGKPFGDPKNTVNRRKVTYGSTMRQSERAHSLSRRGKQRRDKRRENARTQAVDKRNAAANRAATAGSFAIDKAAVHSDGANKGVTSKSGANKKAANQFAAVPAIRSTVIVKTAKQDGSDQTGIRKVEIRPREAVQMLTVPMQTATHEQKEVQVNVRPPKLRPVVLRVTGTNSPVGTGAGPQSKPAADKSKPTEKSRLKVVETKQEPILRSVQLSLDFDKKAKEPLPVAPQIELPTAEGSRQSGVRIAPKIKIQGGNKRSTAVQSEPKPQKSDVGREAKLHNPVTERNKESVPEAPREQATTQSATAVKSKVTRKQEETRKKKPAHSPKAGTKRRRRKNTVMSVRSIRRGNRGLMIAVGVVAALILILLILLIMRGQMRNRTAVETGTVATVTVPEAPSVTPGSSTYVSFTTVSETEATNE